MSSGRPSPSRAPRAGGLPLPAGRRDRGWALAVRQFRALLRVRYLVKRRAPLSTAFEVLATVLLMSLLVLGADLSDVRAYPAASYAERGVNVTSESYAFARDLVAFESDELCERLGTERNASRWLFDLSASANASSPTGTPPSSRTVALADALHILARLAASDPEGDATALARDAQAFLVRRLGLRRTAELELLVVAAIESPSDPDGALNIVRQLKAQAELGADLGLGPYWTERLVELDTSSWNATASSATFSLAPDVVRGLLDPRVGAPLPIPSFDEFCALSYAVTYVAEINESFRALYKASTTLGIRALGNAINLGKLAFAPDVAGVRGLVERLNATHRFFDAHFAGIFASEDAALAALNADGNEDLWAVVALRDEGDGAETLYSSEGSSEGSSGGFARGGRGCGVGSPVLCATAAIRMRFTTVPRTQVPYDRWSPISVEYLKYYTSGFLTLQSAIDEALLRMRADAARDAAAAAEEEEAAETIVSSSSSSSEPIFSSSSSSERSDAFDPPTLWGVPFPRSETRRSTFYESLGPLLGLMTCLSALYPVGMLVKGLVQEKETRARELASIMGLLPGPSAASWVATYAVVFGLVAILTTATIHASVFPTTEWSLLLAFFACVLFTGVPLSFLIASFFTRARLASVAAPFVVFAMGMPRYAFFDAEETQALAQKRLACLLTPSAFAFAADLLATRELAGRGATWATLYEDPLSLGEIMALATGGGVAYAALAWYLGETLPSAVGTPRPWWFVFDGAYWTKSAYFERSGGSENVAGKRGGTAEFGSAGGLGCASKGVAMLVDEERGGGGGGGAGFENSSENEDARRRAEAMFASAREACEAAARAGAVAEEEETISPISSAPTSAPRGSSSSAPLGYSSALSPSHGGFGVVIRGLGKTYNPRRTCGSFWNGSSTPTRAVHDLNLSMRLGEVTGLLGPNGAGKSTTAAMLSGLVAPSEGDALVAGYAVRGELGEVRRRVGMCPQADVLYPTLTCEEHLALYAAIKGVAREDARDAVDARLEDVGLVPKRSARVETLSGGMRRRLQMAIALVGPSEVVLLDEPTSGLDPRSRRDAWRLIRGAAEEGRCVILTTHFLEEADALCDRVAVVSDGRLRCVGSPVFLKNTVGNAYHLTLALDARGFRPGDDGEPGDEGAGDGWGDGWGRAGTEEASLEALRVVNAFVAGARIRRARGGEVTMELPARDVDAFPRLFRALDALVVEAEAEARHEPRGEGEARRERAARLAAEGTPAPPSGAEGTPARPSGAEGTIAPPSGAEGTIAPPPGAEETPAPPSAEPRSRLRLRGYGVSMTTLEEIFLRLAEEDRRRAEGAAPSVGASHRLLKRRSTKKPPPRGGAANAAGKGSSSAGALSLGGVLPCVAPPPHDEEAEIELSPMLLRANGGGGGGVEEARSVGTTRAAANSPRRRSANVPEDASDAVVASDAVTVEIEAASESLRPKSVASSAARSTSTPPSPSPAREDSDSRAYEYASSGRAAAAGPRRRRVSATSFTRPRGVFCASGPPGMNKFSSDVREMLRKRTLIARRDRKSFAYNVLVPILVNVLVMCVLFLEVDPAGPSRAMSPCMFTESVRVGGSRRAATPVPVGGPDGRSAEALAEAIERVAEANGEGWCVNADVPTTTPLESIEPGVLRDGAAMSDWLASRASRASAGGATRYLALVRDDPIMPTFDVARCPSNASDLSDAADDEGFGESSSSSSSVALFSRFAEALANASGASESDAAFYGDAARVLGVFADRLSHEPVTILHNASAPHAVPTMASLVRAAGLAPAGSVRRLSTHSHPLPLTDAERASLRVWLNALAAFFLLLPFSYSAATHAAFTVKERASGARLSQLASGCGECAYWLGAFAFEWATHAVVSVVTWVFFFAFELEPLVGDARKAAASLALLLAFGAAAVPLAFVYSAPFEDHAGATVTLSLINFCTGFVLVNLDFVMRASLDPSVVRLATRLAVFYRLFPPFLLGEGLVKIATSEFAFSSGGTKDENSSWLDGFTGVPDAPSALAWDRAGRPIVLLLAESLGYFALRLAMRSEFQFGKKTRRKPGPARTRGVSRPPHDDGAAERTQRESSNRRRDFEEDADVAAERVAVANAPPGTYDVVLENLTVTYASSRRRGAGASSSAAAVDSLAFGVRRGERFGLLGVNGAGKSTTLVALRGDVRPSGGRARVLGFDCAEETEAARRAVGYCPQFDPLLEFLTGRETVEMHARLKGLRGRGASEYESELSEASDSSSERYSSSSDDDAVAAADRTLAIVGLSAFADRPCGEYSGGNKRKLTLAMALVGRPRVLLLDEPSSGMCPLGRRMMWDAIERAARGLTVVLTTHAMDECEALCDRVGVVADGRLRCVGTAQHLKARFGDGFRVEAKLARGEGADERGRALAAKLARAAAAEDAEDETSERGKGADSFSAAALAPAPGRVRVRVATRDALAEAFAAAERARAEGVVEHYAVTQTTLEDVFARVSGGGEEGEEDGGRGGG